MIEGKTILCFASGYDAPPTSKHHVMHLLAQRNVVLWVNYHASRAPTAGASDMLYMARKLGQVLGGMRRVRKNLYVLTPLVVPLPASATAKRVNQMLISSQIRLALSRVRRGGLQVWTFTPDVSYLLGQFGEEKVLYYCVDDFAHFSGYDVGQVLRDEADLCGKADLVVTTSMSLQQAKSPLNRQTVLVTHGVEYEHFAAAQRDPLPTPADIANIPHPRLGFFGLLRDWVDLDLLAAVAKLRSDWHFVLIGDSAIDLAPYRALPNMHFLGHKPYKELPAYCKQFDVGLIPFKINELTLAANPIKLREYLAAGLPVVSAPLPEVMLYKDIVELAHTPDAFVAAVQTCLTQDDRQRRSDLMASETWPGKLQIISDALAACDCGQPTPAAGKVAGP